MTQSTDKPIGYWLKRAHDAISRATDDLHRDAGITRLDWQVLNTLAEGGDLSELQPFATPQEVGDSLSELIRRGWAVTEDGGLTPVGCAAHRALLARQVALRQRMMAGIGEDEYAAILRVLAHMVANLEEG